MMHQKTPVPEAPQKTVPARLHPRFQQSCFIESVQLALSRVQAALCAPAAPNFHQTHVHTLTLARLASMVIV